MISELRITGYKSRGEYSVFPLKLEVQYRDRRYYSHTYIVSVAEAPKQYFANASSFKKGAPFLATYKQEALYV